MRRAILICTITIFCLAFIPKLFAQQNNQMPEWVSKHMKFLTEGNGRWITDNSKYESKDEPYDEYGIEWKWGLAKKSIKGRLFVLKDKKELGSLWEFRMFWSPIKKKAIVHQFGSDGTFGFGEMRNISSGKKSEKILEMSFHTPRETSYKSMHRIVESNGEYVGESFGFKDSNWQAQRKYVWKLQKRIQSNNLIIPKGKTVNTNGVIEKDEWSEADFVNIEVNSNWTVKVYFKQDSNNLYFRFSNLKIAEKKELYPEVLIDVGNNKTQKWDENDWWFHTSYSNCEGKGIFNNYKTCKKGKKEGWNGNNFPLKIKGDVEIEISKKLLNLKSGDTIGLAFDVTDTQKNWYFYPRNAKLEKPNTWIRAKI